MAEETTASTEEQKEDSKPDKDEVMSATESEKGTGKESEQETDSKSADESESTETETKESEEKEESKADTPTKVSLEEILGREDVQRAIQSVSDKAVAKSERRAKDTARQRRRDEEERQQLADEEEVIAEAKSSGDYGDYGEAQVKLYDKEKAFNEHRDEVNEAHVEVLLEQYRDLGEDALQAAAAKARDDQTGIPGLQSNLADERTRRAVESKETELLKDRNQSIADEVAAQLATAGVEKRTQDAEENKGTSEQVSAKAKSTVSQTPTTDKEWEESYGEGETAFEELPEHIQDKYERVG